MNYYRLFLVLFFPVLLCTAVSAQTEGDWSGRLSVGKASLTLVLHISKDRCTLDSPDQNAKDIAATLLHLSTDSVSLVFPLINASYQGHLADGRLLGTFVQHGQSLPLNLQRGEQKRLRPQTPQPPFPYSVQSVNFFNPDDGAMLSGTLSLPEGFTGNTPVLLMITGSGLQNRDEELFGHKPFFVIADHLARHGIATLRYDDRGTAYSTGNVKHATTATFLQDALAGIRCLRDRGFKRVGALGHSEGGTIALLLAAQKQIDFAVTLAAGATSGLQLLIDQNRALLQQSGMTPDTVEAYCLSLEQVLLKTVQHYRPDISFPIETLLDSLPQAKILSAGLRQNLKAVARQVEQQLWMRHFITIDPIPEISKIRCPLLALGGDKDLQVVVHPNFNALRRHLPRNKRSRLITYPDLNHLFQTCQTGLPDEYGQIEETIAPAVLDDIVRWVLSLK